jgi:dethiobiotin synthetase
MFIAGSGVPSGKTLLSAALVRRLRVLGTRAIGIKPVETGCRYGEDHDLLAPGGALLHRAADRAAPPLVVSPYRFIAKTAPAIAAARSGIDLSLDDLFHAIVSISAFGDPIIITTSGGALSPIANDGSALDLCARIGAPLFLVLPDRLGVESEAIALLEAARRRAIPILGAMLSAGEDAIDLENERLLRELGGVTVFPMLPLFIGDDDEKAARAEEHLAAHGIAEALLDAAARP